VAERFHGLRRRPAALSPEAEAQAPGDPCAIKELRYDNTEYFWINDLGKPVPTMIMHPDRAGPGRHGARRSQRFNKATSMQPGSGPTASRWR
jgi:methyl-accepting chemotaxis protein